MNTKSHEVVKIEKIHKIDTKELAEMIMALAYDTEEKVLDCDITEKAIGIIVSNPNYGFFCVSPLQSNILTFNKGIHLITYAFNIQSNKFTLWIETVFVKKDYRNSGVFKQHMEFTEELAKNSDTYGRSLKLYVDGDNSIAKKVYSKLGFTTMKNIIYERDYYFDKLTETYVEDKNFGVLDFNTKDFDYIKNLLSSFTDVFSFMRDEEINSPGNCITSLEMSGIENVVSHSDYGKIFAILSKNEIVAMYYVHLEYSDWRNDIIWWVYQIKINNKYKEVFEEKFTYFVNTLVYYCNEKCACFRFIYDGTTDKKYLDFKDGFLKKAHFTIEEKVVRNI